MPNWRADVVPTAIVLTDSSPAVYPWTGYVGTVVERDGDEALVYVHDASTQVVLPVAHLTVLS